MKIFFSLWLCGDNWRTTGARDVKFGSEIDHKHTYKSRIPVQGLSGRQGFYILNQKKS